MLPSVGWAQIGTAASLGVLFFAIYQYKAGNLASARDREDHLQNLEGKSLKEGQYHITIDTIEFKEATGILYRIRRWALRPIDGTVYLTVRLHEIGIPDELWDLDHFDVFEETNDFDAECVNSQINPDHTALVFEVDSSEYEDVRLFLDQLLKFFTILEKSGTTSLQRGHSSRLIF
jgi:hypothetical protein